MSNRNILTLICALAIFSAAFCAIARAEDEAGSIQGNISDISNYEPIIGGSVIINGLKQGASTDEHGQYGIKNVPPGEYTLTFSCIGFSPESKVNIVVRPGRITFVDAALRDRAIEVQAVEVSPGLFSTGDKPSRAVQEFNAEEIRRSPGSAGDVSRLLKVLPSQSQVADNFNDLMVRGGSPTENGFFVDGIRIPNINHFPVTGSTGGPIGMLNVDFIDDVDFSAGGFSAEYGDRLSSVTEIRYRNGNSKETDTQLDMSMAGFGGVIEGPVGTGGSYMLSARKSYLDLISGAIQTGVIPRYGDIQGKMTYDLSPRHRLEVLDVYGHSSTRITQADAIEDDMPTFGKYSSDQNTIGLSWRYLWGKSGYGVTSISHSRDAGNYHFDDAATDSLYEANDYSEDITRIQNKSYYRASKSLDFKFGVETEYQKDVVETSFGPMYDRLGNYLPLGNAGDEFSAWKQGGFIEGTWAAHPAVALTLGLRYDRFSETKSDEWSPRASVDIKATDKLNFHVSSGIFRQTMPFYLMARDPGLRSLPSVEAAHYVVGLDYMLTSDTRLLFEAYDKEYKDCPVDLSDPTRFVLDDGATMSRSSRYGEMTSQGKAHSRGMELTVQKKLATKLYGLAGASYSRSEYRDPSGKWYPRNFDTRYQISLLGGYKPNEKWELGFRWNYAGGAPYTPFDLGQSRLYNSGVVDQSRINGERFDDYHALNLQINRRFLFKSSNIVLYGSIWNAYNHKNVAMIYWGKEHNHQEEALQWSFLPVVGLEYEF